ncbi:hypothetical protein PMAYCL1PPCAC_14170, partial [Pristionchus mayeri]
LYSIIPVAFGEYSAFIGFGFDFETSCESFREHLPSAETRIYASNYFDLKHTEISHGSELSKQLKLIHK